jgi:aerobic-type carbon monoxide dehydrogenase small subunit (CoxS/CutS family)
MMSMELLTFLTISLILEPSGNVQGQRSACELDPADEDVRKSIDGNFCRCGSYPNIIKATIEASRKINHK